MDFDQREKSPLARPQVKSPASPQLQDSAMPIPSYSLDAHAASSSVPSIYPSVPDFDSEMAISPPATLSPPPAQLLERSKLSYEPIPSLQRVSVDVDTIVDGNLDHLQQLASAYVLPTLHDPNSHDKALHPFYALLEAFHELEDRYQLTSEALEHLFGEIQPLENLLWTLVDVPIQALLGTCGDGAPVQTAPQTYQVARLEPDAVDNLTSHLVSLHSLTYSNLPDIDSKCQVWSDIVKLRCMELVKRSTTSSTAISSATSSAAATPQIVNLKDIREHLDILLFFERRSMRALRETPSSGISNLSSSADLSSTNFLECIRWCVKYLSFTYNRHASPEDHTWLLTEASRTRSISAWGQDILQIQGMLSTVASDPFGKGLEVAKFYTGMLKRVLSPVLDGKAVSADCEPSKISSTLQEKSKAVRSSGADDIFVWTELDFIAMASQISLGPFLSHLMEAVIGGKSMSDPMEAVGRAATAFTVLEDLLQVISSAIPLVIFHLPSFAKKLADMLVKCANSATSTAAKLVAIIADAGAASLIKSKAEQLQYRAFATLIVQPALWQFLVHLDLANASLELVSCMFSYLYFDDPVRISSSTLTFASWKAEVSAHSDIRSTMVGRISENMTSSYFVYFLVRMLKTHLGHGEFVQVLLYELFSLAYLVDESAAILQKDVREQLLPILNGTPALISLWLRLTGWHLARLSHTCFHPWKGVDLLRYELPDDDAPILKEWLLAADGAPEHYLARFILSSADLGNRGGAIVDVMGIEATELQQRVALMIQQVWHSFATSSSRSNASLDSFCTFCNAMLLRTHHFNYSRFCSAARSFDESVVLASANAFTKGSRNGYCVLDPVTAFGLVEMTGLAGGYLGDNRASSPLPPGVPPSPQDTPTSFELSLRAFFDCGVPTLASLVSGNLETCARLLFDLTSVIAPFVSSVEAFSTDWQSPFFEPVAKFSNSVVIPYLQIPSVIGSMVSLVRGPGSNRSVPPLKSLIYAQYLLCHQVDQAARSFYSHGPSATSLAYTTLDSSALDLESTHPAACPRTSSVLSFWLTTLMLANDWYKIPQVLDAVESVLSLFHAANLFPLALSITANADALVFSREAPVTDAARIGRIPTVLLTILGSFAKDKGLFSSLFGSSAATSLDYPWVLSALLQVHLDSLNWADVGAAAATGAVPGQTVPLSMPKLQAALGSLQPIFEAVIRCLLVLEPSHPASIAIWNSFAQLYFAHCSTNGQTLFYGHLLLLTSTHKSHRDKILSRLSHFAQAFKTSPPAASSVNDPFQPPDDDERRVLMRELLASLDSWLRLDLHKFNDIPALLQNAPMGSWLSAAMDLPSKNHWIARAPRFEPNLSSLASAWSLFLQKPSKEVIRVETYIPTSKTAVDLMELLKATPPGRLDSLQLLRSQRKAQFQDQLSESTSNHLQSSANDPEMPDTSSTDDTSFNIDSDSFIPDAATALKALEDQFSNFLKRKNLHWQLFDRRLLALQALKQNQPQLAVARAQCRLKDKCKSPAEFQVNISTPVIDKAKEAELKDVGDQSQSLFQTALKRNQEPLANRNAVRFVLTMYNIFGSTGESALGEGKHLTKLQKDKLIALYWLLRDHHSAGAIQYAPMLQVFEMLERQILEQVINKDELHVGRALTTLANDPWASQALCGSWSPCVRGNELFQLYEFLWTQHLPHLSATSRATLLGKFKISEMLSGHPSDESKSATLGKISHILKSQLLTRSPQHKTDKLREPSSDVLFEMAIGQLTELARLDFPANLAQVLQFAFDESKNGTLAPSAWRVVLNLPIVGEPGLSAQKLNSVIRFCASYLGLFKSHNPLNHLALWAPYAPMFLDFLALLAQAMARYLHAPTTDSSTKLNATLSPSSSSSSLPDSGALSTATSSQPRSTPPPTGSSKPVDLSLMTTFFDLYAMWIAPNAEITESRATVTENWDSSIEPVAALVASSLATSMYNIIIGPNFNAISKMGATGKFNRDIWTVPQFDKLCSSPYALQLAFKVSTYLFDVLRLPTTHQRVALFERTPFENAPWSLISGSSALLLDKLTTLKRIILNNKHSAPLVRLFNRLFINMLPELSSSPPNPILSSVPFDDEILAVILDLSVIGMTYTPLPYSLEEKNFWSLLPTSLPWDRLSGRRFLRSDFCSTLDVELSQQGMDDAQSPLRQLSARVRSYCDNEKVHLTSSSGCDVMRPSSGDAQSNGAVMAETDRLLSALRLIRSIAHLPSSTSQPTAITILGLTSNQPIVPQDWQTAEGALRMCRIIEATFSAQALLLAPVVSLSEGALWGDNSPGLYATSMLRYLLSLQSQLHSLPTSSPLSSGVRDFLHTRFGVVPHAPDAVAYHVLWSQILLSVASSIMASFNHLEAAFSSKVGSPNATATNKEALLATRQPLWETRLIALILRFASENPGIAAVLVPPILSTIRNPLTAAKLVEGLLEGDWLVFKDMSRLCNMVSLASPTVLRPTSPKSTNKGGAIGNMVELRQFAFTLGSAVTLTSICHQSLSRFSSTPESISAGEPIPESDLAVMQLEPEVHHWALNLHITVGKEYQIFALWFESIKYYLTLIHSNSTEMQTILGAPRKVNYVDQLHKLAVHIHSKSADEGGSSLLRMIGFKAAAPSTPFRVASQLLSLFVLEHLVETPILAPGNKVIAFNVSLASHSSVLLATERQMKRKEALLKTTAAKQPNAAYASIINQVVQFLSRPQKSLADVTEVWRLIAHLFGSPESDMLQSLAQ